MMRVEVDQSGRIEYTKTNTALAFSNGIAGSILILAVDKRECVRVLRKRGVRKELLYYKLFAVALFLLLKDFLKEIDALVIDTEYEGTAVQTIIKGELFRLILREHPSFKASWIKFAQVGKRSPAHKKALAAHRQAEAPTKRVKAAELLRYL
jgi:hypothetical protein